jgi:hypothetical protein
VVHWSCRSEEGEQGGHSLLLYAYIRVNMTAPPDTTYLINVRAPRAVADPACEKKEESKSICYGFVRLLRRHAHLIDIYDVHVGADEDTKDTCTEKESCRETWPWWKCRISSPCLIEQSDWYEKGTAHCYRQSEDPIVSKSR